MSSVSASNPLINLSVCQEVAATGTQEKLAGVYHLPSELMEKIFGYLKAKEVGIAAGVSKDWRLVLNEDPSYLLQISQNHTFFSKNVLSEVPMFKYPTRLIRLLHQNHLPLSKLPKLIYDESIDRYFGHGEVPVPIAIVSSKESGNEKMVFRVAGNAKRIEQIFLAHNPFGHELLFQINIIGVCAIFPERGNSSRYEICSHDSENTARFETVTGNNRIEYSDLGRLLGTPIWFSISGNPISIIRLYCGDDTPYVDLTKYLPGSPTFLY